MRSLKTRTEVQNSEEFKINNHKKRTKKTGCLIYNKAHDTKDFAKLVNISVEDIQLVKMAFQKRLTL